MTSVNIVVTSLQCVQNALSKHSCDIHTAVYKMTSVNIVVPSLQCVQSALSKKGKTCGKDNLMSLRKLGGAM